VQDGDGPRVYEVCIQCQYPSRRMMPQHIEYPASTIVYCSPSTSKCVSIWISCGISTNSASSNIHRSANGFLETILPVSYRPPKTLNVQQQCPPAGRRSALLAHQFASTAYGVTLPCPALPKPFSAFARSLLLDCNLGLWRFLWAWRENENL
jgi:hypothetical protein